MGGVPIGLGPCWAHGGMFEFDPATVATIWLASYDPGETRTVEPHTPGARQVMICDPCVERANVIRSAAGDEPHETSREYGERRGGNWPGAGRPAGE